MDGSRFASFTRVITRPLTAKVRECCPRQTLAVSRSSSLLALAATLVLALAIPGVGVAAQDATPAGEVAGEAIDPAECQFEPIPAERLIALWFPEEVGPPAPATPEPVLEPSSISLPLGEPADPATVAEITATVREVLACINRAENGRFFALVTNDMLRQFGPFPGDTPEDVADVLAPFDPIPSEEYIRLLAVTDVSVMADGRVAALVITNDPVAPPGALPTQLMIFVQEGGRWLLDEQGPGPASTPTP